MSGRTPYQSFAIIASEMRKYGEAGNWEKSAEIAAQMNTLLRSSKLPAPQAADREAIAAVLADIAALTERAGPLKEDIARLLAAFGDTP